MDEYIISYETFNPDTRQISIRGNLAFSANTKEMGAIDFFNFLADKVARQVNCTKDCVLITGVFKL